MSLSARLGAASVWRAAFALARPLFPKANVAMGERMAMNMVFDASPAVADFGWAPRALRPNFPVKANAPRFVP